MLLRLSSRPSIWPIPPNPASSRRFLFPTSTSRRSRATSTIGARETVPAHVVSECGGTVLSFWPADALSFWVARAQVDIPALDRGRNPVGLGVSQYWISKNPSYAYFLLPFRGFQFLMGAACIELSHASRSQQAMAESGDRGCGLSANPRSRPLCSRTTPFPGFGCRCAVTRRHAGDLAGQQVCRCTIVTRQQGDGLVRSNFLLNVPGSLADHRILVVFGHRTPVLATKFVLFLLSVARCRHSTPS